jgi:putative ABC transport system permease protein
MGLRMAAGRALGEGDGASSPPRVVVNASFVTKFLDNVPPREAIGLSLGRMGLALKADAVVAGVVDDMRQDSPTAARQPELFITAAQLPFSLQGFSSFIIVRTDEAPERLASPLRTALQEQDGTLAFDSMMTMEERVSASLAAERTYMLFLAAFAVAALLVVSVGLFGVLSYLVATRTRELAVRTAIGATPGRVMGLVARQAAVIVAAGVVVGATAAAAGAGVLSRFVHGAGSVDPLSFLAAPAAVVFAAALACLRPARRAATVDPAQALRAD